MIRPLDPIHDLAAVAALYQAAGDYWLLADRRPPDAGKAAEFFTDAPPGCDAGQSYRLGLFEDADLRGVAELSFGFPGPGDAYLGLMILDPAARGRGLGRMFLEHLQDLARGQMAGHLYLGVLQENPRGRAFWLRSGFAETGVSRQDAETGHLMNRLVKRL